MSAHLIPEPAPELVRRAQQRDATGKPTPEACAAFATLYEHSRHLIYNFFCLKLGNEQDAQELTQETFTRAWRALPAKDPQAPFVAWLKRIAINLSKDYWQKKQTHQISLDWLMADGVTSKDGRRAFDWLVSDATEEQVTTVHTILHALQSLSLEYQLVLLLQLWMGFSDEETAQAIEISSQSVPKTLWRAKAEFMKHYQALLDPIPSRLGGRRTS
jgi:RNA polymerase sigma-70 factor (ECF subfamily)